jgi:hypothetical protein
MDADQKVVICSTKGKNAEIVKVCKKHLEALAGDAKTSKRFALICIQSSSKD